MLAHGLMGVLNKFRSILLFRVKALSVLINFLFSLFDYFSFSTFELSLFVFLAGISSDLLVK